MLQKIYVPFINNIDLIRNLFISSSGGILIKIIPYLITPSMLKILSADNYGILALLNSFIALTVIFIGLGLRQALYFDFFQHSREKKIERINNILIIYLVIAVPLIIFSLVNISLLKKYIFLEAISNASIVITLLISFLYFFIELFFQILTWEGKIFLTTVMQVFTALCITSFNLIFVLFCNFNIDGIMLSYLLTNVIVFLCGLYYYYKKSCIYHLDIKNINKHAKYYLKTGLPFIPSMLFGWILSSSNRWILAAYCSLASVGILFSC